ncbi:MAG: hypothetical protein E6H90_13455 [Chloroflexi bacterium]|nr:MAG: hypothetical protein E6H90_13455 [Chloroflexota bacterium]
MKRSMALFSALAALAIVPGAGAATGSLFGGASIQGNQVSLVSNLADTSTANDASGISFSNTGVTTFSSLTELATKFNVTDDGCGAGSPRFQINFGTKNVFVYLGPSPTFTGCTPNTLVDSGNLIGNNDACRFDTSQLFAGTQCNTYAGTLALVGSMPVTGIQLVVDSGFFFADKEQTVNVCDIRINGSTVFPCQGQPGEKPGKGKGRKKVKMCHKGHTITVGEPAVKAHLHHGDTMGACTAAQKKAAKKKHHR